MTYCEKIIDISTGEETIRNYTKAEAAVIDANIAAVEAAAVEAAAIEAAREAAKQAVLNKLGLTADEVAALLG
jgi:ribosomal protein L16/L10AE